MHPRVLRHRQESCLRSVSCVIFRSLHLSIKWTERPMDTFELLDDIENELGIRNLSGQLADRFR